MIPPMAMASMELWLLAAPGVSILNAVTLGTLTTVWDRPYRA